jgi:hypothetical protein
VKETRLTSEKMGSRELGLVLAQQLLDVEDLHYGLWEGDLELSLGNLVQAQQRYSEMLIATLPLRARRRCACSTSAAARAICSACCWTAATRPTA